MGEDPAPENDDFPVFDDDFVSGGPVELTATQRAIEHARQVAAAAERARALRDQEFEGAKAARRYRLGTSPRARRKWLKLSVLAAVVGGGGWWFWGHPGIAQRASSQPAAATEPSTPVPTAATVPAGVTTTTVLELENFDYSPGTCVTWDQSEQQATLTTEVPCSQPHLVELVAPSFQITQFGTQYPPDATLVGYYRQQCTGPAEGYLGYQLDPGGRFVATAVGPTAADWADGDRKAWCVLELTSNSKQLTPFSGEVRGMNQQALVSIGACGTDRATDISCAGPHTWQVAGNVDVSNAKTRPLTDSGWQALVGAECGSISLAFLGGSYPPGVQSSWIPISSTGWSLGQRVVQCTVAKFPPAGGNALTITGSLAAARK